MNFGKQIQTHCKGEFISDTTGNKVIFLIWWQRPDDWTAEDCVEIGNEG